MKRFVVRFTGNEEPPPGDLERLRALPESKIIDSSSRMLLMEAPDAALAELVRTIPSWSVSPEEFTPLPDPRPKIRRSR